MNLFLVSVKEIHLLSKWFSSTAMRGLCRELWIPVPWGHIAAKVWGSPDGRPVLCLHGWADNANSFDRLIPLLPDDFQYVVPDFPGHGISSHRPPGISYYMSEYVLDVRRITENLNWKKFTIMGHSMGGNVGGLFCSIFPEMVDKLILLDSYGFLPLTKHTQEEQLKKAFDDLIKLEKEQGSPRVYTPDTALKRLLQGSGSLSEESGRLLLQRGSREVPEGIVFTRDLRINLLTPVRISIDQCLQFQKNVRAAVLLILAENRLSKDEKIKPDCPPYSLLVEGYRNVVTKMRVMMPFRMDSDMLPARSVALYTSSRSGPIWFHRAEYNSTGCGATRRIM
ncbi:serine hydrolase-like protein isoform X3 [Hypanus sabinus]|uniref:serine hydrolase-like protein isoform X3 n=1 Tax=Hypanus sabinus TaxID=79690 RepID=UPI0028C46D45|nr:serine hydrolase-like protein isoform X3 [Hypanus sabinus]